MYITSILSTLLLSSSIVGAVSIPRNLDESHLVLFGDDGRTEVVDKADFLKKYHQEHPEDIAGPIANGTQELVDLEKRGCKSYSIITQNKDQQFLNWDVPMSSVVKAGEKTSTVSVTQGYQISNSIAVSATASLTLIEDFLSASFGITTTKTWTSTYAAAYTYTVPEGKYGVVVSNPWTLRKSGHIDIGCIGQGGQRVTYQSDSYTSKAYDGLAWVTGSISLCTSNSYPVKNCIGNGYMH
ncbi:hypothetical protein DID88_005521 [Monilinia fructigena]|uniref:Celp0028 effector like protein n=1 Tax=Monilinia fructigena TaxID=38457 RepID=A0A395J178_9HELO|nr:hypothetical protein DID88_005521 [Monilinia fructigena]